MLLLSLRCWAALAESSTRWGWAWLASRFGTRPAPKVAASQIVAGALTGTIKANYWLVEPIDWLQWENADQNYFDPDQNIVVTADPVVGIRRLPAWLDLSKLLSRECWHRYSCCHFRG